MPSLPSKSSPNSSKPSWRRQASSARAEIAERFLAALDDDQVDLFQRRPDRVTMLHHVARKSRPEVFDAVLARFLQRPDRDAWIHATTSSSLLTPLHVAAESGHLHAVQKLLAAGANVHALGRNFYDPLSLAAKGCHAPVVKALLAAGASVHAHQEFRIHPLTAVFLNYNTTKLEARLATIDVLLQAGSDPNRPNPWEAAMPALHHAALHCSDSLARLLQAGGDPNHRDFYGRTPLIELIHSHPMHRQPMDVLSASLSLLIQAGADLDAMDASGHTALTLAIAQPNSPMAPDLVRLLLDAGASTLTVQIKADGSQPTPLALAQGKSPELFALVEQAYLRETTQLACPDLSHSPPTPPSRPRL